jgi:hypothetical protein
MDATCRRLFLMRPDEIQVTRVLHVTQEAINVEPDRDRVALEIVVLERVLILEEMIVHLPEATLLAGRLSCDCGSDRERMNVIACKVTENEPGVELDESFPQSFQLDVCPPAMRAFELPILEKGHAWVSRSEAVIRRSHTLMGHEPSPPSTPRSQFATVGSLSTFLELHDDRGCRHPARHSSEAEAASPPARSGRAIA